MQDPRPANPERQYECLQAVASGQDAWPEFWDLFGGLVLWKLGLLGLNSPQLREDLLQDLALKLLNRDCRIIRDFLASPQQGSFAAYLRVLTRHAAISWLRKNRRNLELQPLDAALPHNPGTLPEWYADPASRHQAAQTLCALLDHAADGKADSIAYQIMYLRFVDMESVNSIAARLRLKPNAVTQRIRYYLQRLRQLYGVKLAGRDND